VVVEVLLFKKKGGVKKMGEKKKKQKYLQATHSILAF